jgi:predicted RNA binding protein YcfA (HicA-like mRNA interferase family)
MPRKIRELVAELERAGWMQTGGGKGSHRKFAHPVAT